MKELPTDTALVMVKDAGDRALMLTLKEWREKPMRRVVAIVD